MPDRSPQPPHHLPTAARELAASGVPVFPCVAGGKTPLTRNGFHDATTDLDIVDAWWRRHPAANIATPTGHPGVDVLDVDVRDTGTGWHALRRLEEQGLVVGWIRTIRTPSGGLHIHFPGTAQRNGSLRDLHIDFRSSGGYVLLPPSIGQTKAHSRPYVLLDQPPPPHHPLDWSAVTALLPAPTTPAAQRDPRRIQGDPTPWLAAHVARQVEGNRDNALFWAACRAAEAGTADLRLLIDAAVYAGLPERQAQRTVRSAQQTIARTGGHARPASSPTQLTPPIR